VLLPLFSVRTARGWGLGEIADIPDFARWAASAGLSIWQLLPVNEVSGGETSPYSADSAFALDPVYLSLDELEDFRAIGGRAALPGPERVALERLATQPAIDWAAVRALKARVAGRAFDHFREREWKTGSARRPLLEGYIETHRHWLDDYSVWRAVHDREQRAWWQWPEPWRTHQPAALALARAELGEAILRCCWQQWQLDQQWQDARAQAARLGVYLKGDLPFMVGPDSADVWSRPRDFRRDRRVGTPPDAFSATGQDWGLPAYDWEQMRAGGFAWIGARAARAGALYDLYRVDHVIGLYRTWSRPAVRLPPTGEEGSFAPAQEPEQIALGERVLSIFKQEGQVIAEDLGMVPEFLPPSLIRLGIPGYRVLRWERTKDGSFRDPATWPELSVATTGTHDIEPNAAWYETLTPAERIALHSLPGLAGLDPGGPYRAEVGEAILRALYESPAQLTINQFQDLLGTTDRINVPGTVAAKNWSYRMPMNVADLEADGPLRETLHALAARSRRLGERGSG
jgi:4-alpha-glucanotransferase